MDFYEPNSVVPSVVYSDRYVLLQTYTFRNLDPNTPITNLQFYQFLHSHGADEYGPVVSSCYGSAGLADGLQYYIPFDTVHQTGNFQYDITQWNSRPFVTANHTDYVSFSSTVEPDFVDNDLYKGHSGKPDEGTCIHIEERMLNNTAAVYNNEAGGAMGWSLGTLGAGQTKSMTIAFMCTHQEPVEAPIVLAKTDDVEEGGSVWPGNEITYTISWENDSNQDALDCVLVDYLPAGVDYPQGFGWLDPNFVYQAGDPNYNIEDHTYTWELGTIPANSSGSVQLT
ncbi:MAG: hypothetical protein NTX52_04735, partial [Planctomycetota bacterium]|nr:hypothetical protein [Planctomycetota bacterium]